MGQSAWLPGCRLPRPPPSTHAHQHPPAFGASWTPAAGPQATWRGRRARRRCPPPPPPPPGCGSASCPARPACLRGGGCGGRQERSRSGHQPRLAVPTACPRRERCGAPSKQACTQAGMLTGVGLEVALDDQVAHIHRVEERVDPAERGQVQELHLLRPRSAVRGAGGSDTVGVTGGGPARTRRSGARAVGGGGACGEKQAGPSGGLWGAPSEPAVDPSRTVAARAARARGRRLLCGGPGLGGPKPQPTRLDQGRSV